jgi:hypothetical protein
MIPKNYVLVSIIMPGFAWTLVSALVIFQRLRYAYGPTLRLPLKLTVCSLLCSFLYIHGVQPQLSSSASSTVFCVSFSIVACPSQHVIVQQKCMAVLIKWFLSSSLISTRQLHVPHFHASYLCLYAKSSLCRPRRYSPVISWSFEGLCSRSMIGSLSFCL